MTKSECYIGTPNGVVLCVDKVEGRQFKGRFYHSYSQEPMKFANGDQLMFEVERFYDSLNFPHRTTDERRFRTEKKQGNPSDGTGEHFIRERSKIMSDEKLLSKHGDLGTFIIRVQHRQNSSWQGRITWMEKNKTLYFRSIWEMIKLIADALGTVDGSEEMDEEQTWEL